ncbi:MAG: SDR family NAD(P)-dependent oxidoreductase [Alphaproteobacteria bacterium]|nr:SDR family NAD(P)-dependent oxidoreductase [Alphaproteobacteria bacterium]
MKAKVVLVTGTSSGLGASVALQAAKRGHKVYATMRDLGKKEGLEAAANGAKVQLSILALDVQNMKSIETAVDDIIGREGRIDAVVNNAGTGYARSTEQAPLEDVSWIMDVNFMGAVRMTKVVIPYMRKARSGHFINISSVGGLVGQPFNEIYCASKFALEGFTEALASYVQPHFGVKFTAVEPGGISSEFFNSALKRISETGGLLQDEYLPILEKYMAKSRERGQTAFQTPDQVAAVVVKCLEAKDPPLRIRTSKWANDLCRLKTYADPDGKKLQRKVIDMFLGR